jgi:hypothetical protein
MSALRASAPILLAIAIALAAPPRAHAQEADEPDRDLPTMIAVSLSAYFTGSLVHEGLGHGVACAMVGGHHITVTTAAQDCDTQGVSVGGVRWIKASGTVANLVAGGATLAALEAAPPEDGAGYLGLWAISSVNLLKAGGYLMTDPLFGFGDWTQFNATFERRGLLRAAEVTTGVGLYAGAILLERERLDEMLGDAPGRQRRAAWLTLVPYAVGGVAVPLSAALTGRARFVLTAALATLGGTSALLWMSTTIDEDGHSDGRSIDRSWPWLTAGALSAAGFVLFGRGVTF